MSLIKLAVIETKLNDIEKSISDFENRIRSLEKNFYKVVALVSVLSSTVSAMLSFLFNK